MAAVSAVDVSQGIVAIVVHVAPELESHLHNLVGTLAPDTSIATPLELCAHLLEHCAAHSGPAALAVLGAMCRQFGIPATNVHVVVQQHGLDEAAARRVLRAYYLLWDVEGARHCYRLSDAPALPALFASDATRLTAMFGGQPGSSAYLDEARWLLDVYRPLLGDYVARMSAFLGSLAQDSRLAQVYTKGLDAHGWISQSGPEPGADYLVAAPVSMPLAGLVQLMQVMVLHKTLGV
ncbi:hypothetical protein LPJ61_006802, partial [Coemansia biformis]